MTKEHEGYLAHYGVKGQKWGVRNYQNEDGTYTEAGKHHYGWGYGRQTNGGITPKSSGFPRGARATTSSTRAEQQVQRKQPTQEEIAARKARTRRIIGIAAGVTVAAAIGYGAYKGGKAFGNWRRQNALTISSIDRQKKVMELNRLLSKDAGGWSRNAEQSYRKNLKRMNRAQLKAYFGKRF